MTGASASATLHTLGNADGSVTYTSPNGTLQIVVGVNYPIEVPFRSDENPESTVIEVNLRPHNGVGMVKERHVERLIKRTIQALVLGEETPRTMLQITLQIVGVEIDETLPGGVKEGGQEESYLHVLTGAVNASILSCLDAAVQMKQVAGAALVGIGSNGDIIGDPGVLERKKCQSLHVFAFTGTGKVLLMESEGQFTFEEWGAAQEVAKGLVTGRDLISDDDIEMNGSSIEKPLRGILDMMRKSVEAKVAQDERWHES